MKDRRNLENDKRWLEKNIESGNEMEVERIAIHAVDRAINAESMLHSNVMFINNGWEEERYALQSQIEKMTMPRPIDEWHEDYGDVLWWTFPIEDPPYCGSPLADDWPDCHTHWTPIIIPDKANTETGIFFCGNCGGTINKELTYKEKPIDDCGNCGFNEWIFEPSDDGADGQV